MNKRWNVLIVAGAAALAGAPRAWSAPQATLQPEATVRKAEVSGMAIQLKNVPPSWMARMLNPSPATVEQSTANLPPGAILARVRKDGVTTIIRKGTPEGDKFEADTKARLATGAGVFSLPEGVESIVPDDASGELQVRGTAEGIEKLRAIVAFLDLPLRRVELEVLSVRVNMADLNPLGTDWATPASSSRMGFVRGAYREKLREMLDANRATVLLDARATVVNNMGCTLSSGAFDAQLPPVPRVELQFVPTINNDDTITVVMQSSSRAARSEQDKAQARAQSVANVRDGDTILLAGLDGGEARQLTATFITARIIRRDDEKK